MLCRKCKTSIINGERVCGYCGTPVRSYKGLWLVYVIASAVIVLIFIALSGLLAEETEIPDSPTAEPVTENITDAVITQIKPSANPTNLIESIYDEDENKIITMIENVATAATNYVESGIKYVYFISKNGYLYDDVNNKYIITADLYDIDGFNTDYANENVLILYLLVNEFTLTAEETENHLEVFCTYETAKGFYIASPQGYIGIMTREALRDLLLKYTHENSQIVRFKSDSSEFKDIRDAIVRYTNTHDALVARYIAGDSKYAFAVVSFEGSNNIKEYALERGDDGWSVFCSDFEERYDYKSVINTARPDFNSDLFPSYSFYFHAKYIKQDFDDVIAKLIEYELIPSDYDLIYASGSDLFSYLEFSNGSKLLCYAPRESSIGYSGAGAESTNEISVYPISSYVEGENLMRVLSQDPPFYILKQE